MVLPVGRALATGRAAVWGGGSQDCIPEKWGWHSFNPKTQPNPAWEQCLRCTQIIQEKNSCFPASPTSGGKGISPRKDGSAQPGEWEAEQWFCFFIHVMKNTGHKRTLSQRGRRLQTPEYDEKGWKFLLHRVSKALLTPNRWKERTKGAENIHDEWKGGKRRWPSKCD